MKTPLRSSVSTGMKIGIVRTGAVGCAVNRGSAREIVMVNRTRNGPQRLV